MYIIQLESKNGMKDLNKITDAAELLDNYEYFNIIIDNETYSIYMNGDDVYVTSKDEDNLMFVKFYLRSMKYICGTSFTSKDLYGVVEQYLADGEDIDIIAYKNRSVAESNIIPLLRKSDKLEVRKSYFIYIRDEDYHENQLRNFMTKYNLDYDDYSESYKYDKLLIHKDNKEYNMSENYVYELIEGHYDGRESITCTIREDILTFYVFDKDKYSKLIIVK